ncbi:hypothetical protein EDB87DRAFT_1825940 [Lactarius vividus]|nr:hypothetical protein EDB87DRAFT_1825940 [Lactarius vividus]
MDVNARDPTQETPLHLGGAALLTRSGGEGNRTSISLPKGRLFINLEIIRMNAIVTTGVGSRSQLGVGVIAMAVCGTTDLENYFPGLVNLNAMSWKTFRRYWGRWNWLRGAAGCDTAATHWRTLVLLCKWDSDARARAWSWIPQHGTSDLNLPTSNGEQEWNPGFLDVEAVLGTAADASAGRKKTEGKRIGDPATKATTTPSSEQTQVYQSTYSRTLPLVYYRGGLVQQLCPDFVLERTKSSIVDTFTPRPP